MKLWFMKPRPEIPSGYSLQNVFRVVKEDDKFVVEQGYGKLDGSGCWFKWKPLAAFDDEQEAIKDADSREYVRYVT